MNSGARPRPVTVFSSAVTVSSASIAWPTTIARDSRVYSLMMVSSLMARPFTVLSNWKSSAQTWSGRGAPFGRDGRPTEPAALSTPRRHAQAFLAPQTVDPLDVARMPGPGRPGLTSVKGDLADLAAVAVLFVQYRQERVVYVATYADARASTEDSCAYCDANIVGFDDVHKGCRVVKG